MVLPHYRAALASGLRRKPREKADGSDLGLQSVFLCDRRDALSSRPSVREMGISACLVTDPGILLKSHRTLLLCLLS